MSELVRKKNLPRSFSAHPAGAQIIAEADIGVTYASRLRAKVLVFGGPMALRRFWRDALGRELGRKCLGVVTQLRCDVFEFLPDGSERRRVEQDDRYFCIIGLSQKHLTMEIITHESVHAGYAYQARNPRKRWPGGEEMPEEDVCHPAGRIAAGINRFLYERKLYR